ncbi:MAG: CoA-binding protein [Candidatus Heimdallarchaeota archaeon]|nr:CoA-binding protein [Candidatus Heimdallarchaeota archaeon]
MATKQQIIDFLTTPQRIAIIGMSPDSSRPSHFVPEFLEKHGHEIVPVHPILDEIAGKPAFKKVGDVVPKPDAVIIYIGMRSIDRFVQEAIDAAISLIWLPLEITSDLKSDAEAKGIIFVENRCPKIDWNTYVN